MENRHLPNVFLQLQAAECIREADVFCTEDGFFLAYKSLADILAAKGIFDFLGSDGKRRLCSKFFDDWFLYAVPGTNGYTYSLLKLREQEYDYAEDALADGDVPGVTISFVAFSCEALLACLENSSEENRGALNREVNRVVALPKQKHNGDLKRYFVNPKSEGAYLVADVYVRYIASLAADGCVSVPTNYREVVRQSNLHPKSAKLARLPRFVAALRQADGEAVCDGEKICVKNREALTPQETAAILATHTGNTSVYSFAAEVEYHARFLTAWAKIRIPFLGHSPYASAIRADMSVGDTEFQGPAPFYRAESGIVKRQYALHKAHRE